MTDNSTLGPSDKIIEIWKEVVSVQMHFNEIGMRIRGMFVTVILAFFAAMGFLIDQELYIFIWGARIQFAIFVSIIGIYVTWLFYFIDRYWYHRLLVGSVKHGILIENKYKEKLPELALSDAIGRGSPFTPSFLVKAVARIVVTDKRYKQEGKLHSDGKIELFYKSVMLVMGIAAVLLALAGGVTIRANGFEETPAPADKAAPAPTEETPAPADKAAPAPTEVTPAPAEKAAPAPTEVTPAPAEKAAPAPTEETPAPAEKAAPAPLK